MIKILVCDDEKDIVSALRIYLTAEGYEVCTASNGKEALEVLSKSSDEIKLILLDIMMPVMDGISAMSRIREHYNIPIILLTAKSEDSDKVLGLGEGADDYVTKPFSPTELLARVRSHLRRYTKLGGDSASDENLTAGGIELNTRTREVSVCGETVTLTATEYDILKFFMERPGQVLSTKEIYRSVWKSNPIGEENTIAVHIRHLREKIEIDPSDPRVLKVVWGQGYKFDAGNGGKSK